MNFKRHISEALKTWKNKDNFKPLILRGARQVGKTTLIKDFAKSFKYHIYLNLERENDKNYFELHKNVHELVDVLFLSHNIPLSNQKETLLFIDEIQESPKAIQWLRFFYEDFPNLHVIAAGSLLEFSLRYVKSFPVGRVQYMYLHPLNFEEFLEALDYREALIQLQKIPMPDFAHSTLKNLFHKYIIIGGMPEVVKTYKEKENLSDLVQTYESLLSSYMDDVEKYAKNETERKVIKHIIGCAHLYIDQRIKFQNFGNSNYKSREVGEAFRSLDAAKIIQLIYPVSEYEPPPKVNIRRSPKLQYIDTGLLNYALKIQGLMTVMEDLNNAYKGAIIPHIVTQELISMNHIRYEKPCFWVREKLQASAEIDLVLTYRNMLIPVEIKSGPTGALRSLHAFMDNCPHIFAVRIYAGHFAITEHKTLNGKMFKIMNLPYYLSSKLPQYVAYFANGNVQHTGS